jgi:hypothetical protein
LRRLVFSQRKDSIQERDLKKNKIEKSKSVIPRSKMKDPEDATNNRELGFQVKIFDRERISAWDRKQNKA